MDENSAQDAGVGTDGHAHDEHGPCACHDESTGHTSHSNLVSIQETDHDEGDEENDDPAHRIVLPEDVGTVNEDIEVSISKYLR